MPHFVLERLKAEGLRSRAEAEAWETMCRLLSEHPALLDKLHAILLDPESNGLPDPARMAPARRPDLLNWQRVSGFILSRGNEWASFRDIAEGTGLSRTCVQWVLYTGEQSVFFEQKKASDKGRKKLWRVKPEFVDDPTLQAEAAQEKPAEAPTPIVVGPRSKYRPTSETNGHAEVARPSQPRSKYAPANKESQP